MKNSFKVVHEKKMSCIAFPAIGTGNLKMPPRFVAEVMIDEFMKFSKQYTNTTLKHVRFILYHTNCPAIEASKHIVCILQIASNLISSSFCS